MGKEAEDKAVRVLSIYNKLAQGKIVYKNDESRIYKVNVRTIQRDISDIKSFLQRQLIETGERREIIYDKEAGGYRLISSSHTYMNGKELLAICKILLESRALMREELEPILHKLIQDCKNDEERKLVSDLVRNERYHYVELQHGKMLLNRLWEVEKAVKERRYLQIGYTKMKNHEYVERKVCPVGVMFSEFYFYMAAFIEDIDREKTFQNPNDSSPTIYRLDRLEKIKVLNEHFSIADRDRFEEGEFRKRVQFMYGGKLQTTVFWYSGSSIEVVLDRLPTAKIVKEKDGKYLVKAETFGTGIEMWLRSQGSAVEVVRG